MAVRAGNFYSSLAIRPFFLPPRFKPLIFPPSSYHLRCTTTAIYPTVLMTIGSTKKRPHSRRLQSIRGEGIRETVMTLALQAQRAAERKEALARSLSNAMLAAMRND